MWVNKAVIYSIAGFAAGINFSVEPIPALISYKRFTSEIVAGSARASVF